MSKSHFHRHTSKTHLKLAASVGVQFWLFLALLFPFGASASGQDWPRESLGDYSSEAGEGLAPFLLRVGGVLHAYTKKSGNEACGVIGVQGDRYSVKLHTDGVPHGCAMRASDVMEGFSFTGETIHSHPWQKLLVLTPKARAWSRHHGDGNEGSPSLRNDGAGGFSKADYASGAGWLVAKGQLMHQSGKGSLTRHGSVVN